MGLSENYDANGAEADKNETDRHTDTQYGNVAH